MAAPKSFMLSDVVPNAGAGEPNRNTRTKGDLLLAKIDELLGDQLELPLQRPLLTMAGSCGGGEGKGGTGGCSSCSGCGS
jgi:hypothetical protein